jgi:hypothetical protein
VIQQVIRANAAPERLPELPQLRDNLEAVLVLLRLVPLRASVTTQVFAAGQQVGWISGAHPPFRPHQRWMRSAYPPYAAVVTTYALAY